jgi:hypothetical protein
MDASKVDFPLPFSPKRKVTLLLNFRSMPLRNAGTLNGNAGRLKLSGGAVSPRRYGAPVRDMDLIFRPGIFIEYVVAVNPQVRR